MVGPGRGGLILVLGSLVLVSAIETGSGLLFLMAVDGVAGSALLIFGVERSAHRFARPARVLGGR